MASASVAPSTPASTPTRILRKRTLLERIPFSGTTLWRLIKAGQFPRPIQLGPQCVGWIESEVDAWLADRAARRG